MKGCPNDLKNCRPVSILNAFSNIFERAVYFIIECNLLCNFQHGFLKGKSIESALFGFTDGFLRSLECRWVPCGFLLDLSSGFDSISHQILN